MGNRIYDEDRIIALLDILGFSRKVRDSKENVDVFDNIFWVQDYLCIFQEENDSDSLLRMKEFEFEVNAFSDCLVISCPNKGNNLFTMIMRIIHLHIYFAKMDTLLRGAITVGELYHENNMLLGPAMIEAYNLESKVAVYPRIIVEDFLIKQFKETICDETDKVLFDSLLKKDSDGWMYVDFLSQSQEFDNPETEYEDWVKNLQELVNNNINNKDVSVRTKYMWLDERIKELRVI